MVEENQSAGAAPGDPQPEVPATGEPISPGGAAPASPGPPEEPDGPKPAGFAAIVAPTINAIISPSKCWQTLDAKPTLGVWILVWVALITLGISIFSLPLSKDLMFQITRASVVAQGQEVTGQAAQDMRDTMDLVATVIAYASPLLVAFFVLLMALLIWGGASLMGGRTKFSRSFALASAGGVIHPLLNSVYVTTILNMNPPEIRRPEDQILMTPTVGLDLLFTNADLPLWLMTLLSRIDLFNIWWIALVASGSVVLLNLKKRQGIILGIVIWVLSSILPVGGAFLQSLS